MYILKCADGSYYVGSTKDLKLRIVQHQAGLGAKHTRKRLPVELVYFEEYSRIDVAFYREKQIQRWRREKKEALINGEYEKLPGLAQANINKLPSTSSGSSLSTSSGSSLSTSSGSSLLTGSGSDISTSSGSDISTSSGSDISTSSGSGISTSSGSSLPKGSGSSLPTGSGSGLLTSSGSSLLTGSGSGPWIQQPEPVEGSGIQAVEPSAAVVPVEPT